ncbi:MAG: ABC transporter ATP-binding protein, partial [Roseiflexaceae bacterium]
MWHGIRGMASLPEGKADDSRTTAKRLARYLRPHVWTFVWIIGLSLIGAVNQALSPVLIGRAVDDAITTKDTGLLWQYMLALLA